MGDCFHHRKRIKAIKSGSLGLLIFLCLSLSQLQANAERTENKKAILYLNSYHKGYHWSDEITQGIEDQINQTPYDLYIEYLDTKRQYSDSYKQELLEVIKLKYHRLNYDIVITSDDNAFNFYLDNRSLFKDVPMVFCGVNYLKKEQLNQFHQMTGIAETGEIKQNIQLIQELHPQVQRVLVIGDDTPSGRSVQAEVRRIQRQLTHSTLKLDLLYDVDMQSLWDTLQTLKQNTVVLYTFFARDNQGEFAEFDEMAANIMRYSNVPVYSAWDFNFGRGIVGGYITSGYMQGQYAAQKALQILDGRPVDEIPVTYKSPQTLIFDYGAVQRNDIHLKRCSSPYELVNEPKSFWYVYRVEILFGLALAVAILVSYFALLVGLVRLRRLKRKLVSDQEWYTSLVGNLPSAIYRIDYSNLGGQTVYLSHQIEKITGYSEDYFLHENVEKYNALVFEADRELKIEYVRHKIKEKERWEMDYRFHHADGSLSWIKEVGVAKLDKEGKVLYLDGILLDITLEKETEELLKLSERRFRSIFSASPLGIVYFNAQGIIEDVNPALADIADLDLEQFIGTNLLQDSADKNFVQQVQNVLAGKMGYYEDDYFVNSKQQKVPLKVIFRPIKDLDGQVVGGIGLVEDITLAKIAEQDILDANERLRLINQELETALQEARRSKELEIANKDLQQREAELQKAHDEILANQTELQKVYQELKESNEVTEGLNGELQSTNDMLFEQKAELESAMRKLKEAQNQLVQAEKMSSVGLLTSGIAHEINNPLNYIQGGRLSLQYYIEENLEEHGPELFPILDMIENGINRASEIVQGLNRFSRNSERFTEKCDLNFILDNVLLILHNQLKYHIEIEKDYTHDAMELLGNEGRLHQLFMNIIVNASQAIGEKGRIRLQTQRKETEFEVRIQDDGCGIPEENLAHINEPFFTTKDPGEGTGLGLSIAYSIVSEHKGTINYESTLGKGTTVILTFPIQTS